MSKRRLVGLLALIALFVGSIFLLKAGVLGFAFFVIGPVLLGKIGAWITRPPTGKAAAQIGAIAALLGSFSLLALGMDGAICIVMALPLALPLGALGGWLVYKADSSSATTGSATMFLLLTPASIFWDVTAKPQVFTVHSSVEIAASPEQVWKHIVTFPDIPEPTEWFFKTGIAYPQKAHIEGTGVGAVRYCEFSTGSFVEPIEVWDEPRLLRFKVTSSPPPMHEWSPYSEIMPQHLHGYLISKQGEFRLTRLGDHRTLLEGTTLYQHGLWPAQYWRWWSDAIIHRIHLRALGHIRTLAEADGAISN